MRAGRWLFVPSIFVGACVWFACVGEDPPTPQENPGTEGASCDNGGCLSGLVCLSNRCVVAEGGATIDAPGGNDATSNDGNTTSDTGTDAGCGTRLIFVTGSSWTPSGLANADVRCAAEGNTLLPKCGGAFRALLQVDGGDSGPSYPFALPDAAWVLPNGTSVAPTTNALLTSAHSVCVLADGGGLDASEPLAATVWLGSATANCNLWAINNGDLSPADLCSVGPAGNGSNPTRTCDSTITKVYCVEVP